ncbi:MAG: alpha/beta hydrolase, partial [Burkholderiales bacterium]
MISAVHASAQVVSERDGIPGTEVHRIDEPVFGGKVAVHEAGRGNARSILLVHGIGAGGARDYREQIEWLKKSFHVVAPDLPGFGASDKGNLLYSPSNYAAVLKRVADRFLERPFILVGHSMGAVVSLRYAATYPGDVDRLVVIDAPGILHRVSSASQFLAYLGVEFVPPAVEPMEEIANLARRFLAPLARLRLDPQIILASAQLRETLLGGDPARIAGLAVVSEDLRTALPRVRAPTLLVWGGKDALAPPRNGRVLALKLPHAQLQVIGGAAHTPMIEAPERLRAVLEPFLELGLPPPQAKSRSLGKHGEGRCLRERNRVF